MVFLTSGRMLPLKKVSMQTFCSILVTPRSHVWPEDTKKNSCGKFPKFGKLTSHGHSNHKIGGQKLLIVIIRSGLRILLKTRNRVGNLFGSWQKVARGLILDWSQLVWKWQGMVWEIPFYFNASNGKGMLRLCDFNPSNMGTQKVFFVVNFQKTKPKTI